MTIVTSREQDVEQLAPAAAGVLTFRIARVNLLPPEIEEARRLRRTHRIIAAGLTAVVAALGGGYAYAVHDRRSAEGDLADVQALTRVLQRDQAKYSDVPRTIAAIDAAELARETALANDVQWARTLADFSLSLPDDVRFTSLTLSLGASASGAASGTASGAPSGTASGTASGGASPAAPTPGTGTSAPAVSGGIGSVAVEGTARTNRDVATWLDTLSKRPGMTNPYFTAAQRDKVGKQTIVKFSSSATLTDDVLSHRYDRKQG
jgi:Tfp pilus assembly protein PilN